MFSSICDSQNSAVLDDNTAPALPPPPRMTGIQTLPAEILHQIFELCLAKDFGSNPKRALAAFRCDADLYREALHIFCKMSLAAMLSITKLKLSWKCPRCCLFTQVCKSDFEKSWRPIFYARNTKELILDFRGSCIDSQGRVRWLPQLIGYSLAHFKSLKRLTIIYPFTTSKTVDNWLLSITDEAMLVPHQQVQGMSPSMLQPKTLMWEAPDEQVLCVQGVKPHPGWIQCMELVCGEGIQKEKILVRQIWKYDIWTRSRPSSMEWDTPLVLDHHKLAALA